MKPRIKKTSMQDIADYLNISKNSVALALKNKKGVSDKLKEKIIQTAIQLNYGGVDRRLSRQRNLLLLIPGYLVDPEVARHFYHEIIWGIERLAQKQGFNLIMSSLDREKEEALKLPPVYAEMPISGIILLGIFSERYAQMIGSEQIPFVAVDHAYKQLKCHSVVTANLEGSKDVVTRLARLGHRKIGYIGPVAMSASNKERWAGYLQALNEQEVIYRHEFCLTESTQYSFETAEIREFVKGLADWPTAWFCANDNMAISLIEVLAELGLKVPEDVSVAGFDDIPAAEIISPKLTTYRVRRDAMSEMAIEVISKLIEKSEFAYQVKIYGTYLERESTGMPVVQI